MKSPLLTAECEKRLGLIAQGKENWNKFLADIVINTRELVSIVLKSGKEYKEVVRPEEKGAFEQKAGLETGRGNRKQKSYEHSLVKQFGNQRKRQEEEETLGDLFDFLKK